MPPTLRWRKLYGAGRLGQIAWCYKAEGEEYPLHDHDFPEFFWMTEGRMRHTINGRAEEIGHGVLEFIRPADCHEFRGVGPGGGVACNFAVHPAIVRHLRARYFPRAKSWWWDPAEVPVRHQLGFAEIRLLNRAAQDLAMVREPDLLLIERFLLNLFQMLQQLAAGGNPEAEPTWLTDARKALNDPQHLSVGVDRLVQLSGRSPEHLARTVRRVHGATPTDLVNRARLDWAASELLFSSQSITDIALAAGFESLSHFYRLFRRQHRVTPREFRMRARTSA